MSKKTGEEGLYSFYEFFAGTGMARLGLGEEWNCAWANDNDPRKVAIYEHNFGSEHLDSRSVNDVAEELEENRSPGDAHPTFPRDVDMAWASFPCQDLSLAGWQRGMSSERSGAYWPFWKIMRSLQQQGSLPPVICLENVKGLLYGESFLGLCESLAALGMRFGAFLADARHFVPQSRPRVFVIAVHANVDLEGLVAASAPQNSWFPKSVIAAHGSLPAELQEQWVWWNASPPTSYSTPEIAALFEDEPGDVQYSSDAQTERLLSLMTPLHRGKVDAALEAGGTKIGFLYRRTRNGQQRAEVRFDGIAGCLRTPKGGSSRQTVVVVKDGKVRSRLLSRIEAARLMGISLDAEGRLPGSSQSFFPSGYTYNDAYKAMGDGVAVPVVQHLASTLVNELVARAKASTATAASGGNAFLESVDRRISAWAAASGG